MSTRPAHWVKPNAASRVPSRWVFFDSEATERTEGWDRLQSWRLAVTACDWRRRAGDPWRPTAWAVHRDPGSLWRTISGFTRANVRTIVVAHNLAYDLRVTDAFAHLHALGWDLQRLSLHDRAVGAVLRRERRTLVLCDSMAFLPMGLDKVGQLVGTQKVDLPRFDGPDDDWVTRCRVDVTILRAAMMDVLGFIEDDDLGNWARTGAGVAWNAWRHRHYTHKVLVHDDTVARAAEAAACYTGRCEAWRHGRLRQGAYTLWDLPAAYSTVCLDLEVPRRLLQHGTRRSTASIERPKRGVRLLCRAEVTTAAPTLPYRHEGRTCWPVGELAGWWWDDELRLAIEYGAQVQVAETYTYAAAPLLADWARWIIERSSGRGVGNTPVRAAFATHMARALVGRFATRFTPWEIDGPADEARDTVERVYYTHSGETGRLLTLGATTWQGMGELYSADACVFVLSAVMAECRIRLWRCMVAAGLDHVVYVDTDGLVTDEAGSTRLADWVATGAGWGLRVKSIHRRLEVLGPRQLVVDGRLKVAGIPKSARRVNGTTVAGEVWSSLPGSLQRGELDTVRISPRTWKLDGVDHRRLHLPDGATAPLVAPWHVPGPAEAATA